MNVFAVWVEKNSCKGFRQPLHEEKYVEKHKFG